MGRRRVDLQTAAELLGISSDAVRKRAKRGNMPYETGADGKLYVWVDDGETEDHPTGDQDDRDSPDKATAQAELVESLLEQVAYMREQLAAEREANRENRRLLAAALERIPAIESPETPQAPETASESPEGTETPDQGEGYQEATERRSWWRRWFGGE